MDDKTVETFMKENESKIEDETDIYGCALLKRWLIKYNNWLLKEDKAKPIKLEPLKRGFTKKGGINLPPSTSRPEIPPKPAKPKPSGARIIQEGLGSESFKRVKG